MRSRLVSLVASIVLSLGLVGAGATTAYFSCNNVGFRGAASTTAISGTSTGNTTLCNSESDEIHPFAINIETTSASGVVTPAIISIGTNSPNYNNIVSMTTVPTSAGTAKTVLLDSAYTVIPNSTDVVVKVGTAAIGTSQNFKVAILGHTAFP